MKAGEVYQEKNNTWNGRVCYIKLLEYLKNDLWRVHAKIKYTHSNNKYRYLEMTGADIKTYFVKVKEA